MSRSKQSTPKKGTGARKSGRPKPQRRKGRELTKPELRVIIQAVKQDFFKRCVRLQSELEKEWAPTITRTLKAWRGLQERDSKPGRRRKKPKPIPPLDLKPQQIDYFAAMYLAMINGAAGYFASLLAQAASVRWGLGEEVIKEIRRLTDKFALYRYRREEVSVELACIISHLGEAPKLPGFEAVLLRVLDSMDRHRTAADGKKYLWLSERDDKLRLAVALFGPDRLGVVRRIPGRGHTFEDLKNKGSAYQVEVAEAFGFSDSYIRRMLRADRLTRTPTGRILIDEKFEALWNLYRRSVKK